MKRAKSPPIRMSHPKPIVPRTLVALVAACIVVIVMYAALISVLHAKSLYSKIASEKEKKENVAILTYIAGPVAAKNNLDFLSSDEQSHMTDVKHLFDAAYILDLIAAGLLIGVIAVFAAAKMWTRFDELLERSLRGAGWTILPLCFFLGLATLINFEKLWILFHAIFFPQGNWAFAPDSILITLYPEGFWQAAVVRWTAFILSFAIVAILLSYIMERMRRAEHYFTEMHDRRNMKKR
jgi:integral membrane protein (TIGR01906 family)